MKFATRARAALLASTAALLTPVSAQAYCIQRGEYYLQAQGPWSMTLQVSSGKRCRKGFRADGEEHFERLLITEEPKHGAIDLAPGGRFFYTSKEGYKGADSFKIEVCGSFNGKKGCAKMNYAVTVY